jgi:transcriptional regulator with XRE-family HTH domain
MATKFLSTEELEAQIGKQVRAARLAADVDQISLAERANVALGSLKSLEAGRGSTLRTLVRVVRALDLEEWLNTLYEVSPVSPLALARAAMEARPTTRASNRRRDPDERL